MGKIRTTAALLAMLGMACAAAHHSFAMFDQTQRLTLKGTVSEFQWTNPHAFIQLSVTTAAGAREDWSIELNSPNNLKRQGWSSSSLKRGDQVTLEMHPLRKLDDHKGGLFIQVTLADGKMLKEAAFAGNRGPVNVPALPPPAQ
jgi:hypothetical protein